MGVIGSKIAKQKCILFYNTICKLNQESTQEMTSAPSPIYIFHNIWYFCFLPIQYTKLEIIISSCKTKFYCYIINVNWIESIVLSFIWSSILIIYYAFVSIPHIKPWVLKYLCIPVLSSYRASHYTLENTLNCKIVINWSIWLETNGFDNFINI